MRPKFPCVAAQSVNGQIVAYSVARQVLVTLSLKDAAAQLPPADFARVAEVRQVTEVRQ
jgi:hypothetical protein